jgi:two-component system, NtrC family, response regulator AtoC
VIDVDCQGWRFGTESPEVSESVVDPSKTRTIRPLSGTSAGTAPRIYLLVLQGDSSWIYPLPPTGVVSIGRTPDADLPLNDETASRNHAKIMTADGQVRLHDLDSYNGTFVNGERVEGTRLLLSGDVVTLGELTLILHAQPAVRETRQILDPPALRQRLLEEVDRALRYQRPLTLLGFLLPPSGARDEVAAAIAAELRLIDLVGWVGSQLVVAMPELEVDPVALGERLAALAGGARVGLAVCPHDGCDADTLAATVQAAAAAARPGQVAAAAAAARELTIGDRTIVIADPAMARLFDLIRRLATSDLPILILGETGAGKEGAALAVHHGSTRARGPFVTLNCAAIAETLVESELFGHERGAFTGAVAAKAGKLEAAHGGTLFLDEIGELGASLQAKLLRALEQKRITRLGDVREREIDIRIVAATNRSLEEEVKAGRFRQDLFFRLGAATVVLPPLRDRPREIPMLARRFLEEACARSGREPPALSVATMQKLTAHAWPGNVRELRNTMEYLAATVSEDTIEPWHLPERIAAVEVDEAEAQRDAPAGKVGSFRPLADEVRELEQLRMCQALEAAGGVQVRAAALIGMPLRTFAMKVKQHGITPRRRGA